MGRTNPDTRTPNPSFRFFEWRGKTGTLEYYDKEAEKRVSVGNKFVFVLLNEFTTIRGFNKAAGAGVYSNEVSDLEQPLTVKIFKTDGVVAQGVYSAIRDHITSKKVGGVFAKSLYIAVKDGTRLRIANLILKGASLGAWFDFTKVNKQALYKSAIAINGSKSETNGDNSFESPVFELRALSAESDDEAGLLQKHVAEYFKAYSARKLPADTQHHQSDEEPEREPAQEPDLEPEQKEPGGREDLSLNPDEIPF